MWSRSVMPLPASWHEWRPPCRELSKRLRKVNQANLHGPSQSDLPLALVMTAVIAVPGILIGWLGGLIRCRRAAAHG
jgi:hypothetical protein